MATPSSPYTLYAYSPSPESHSDLPFLDPAALYAASLLANAGVPLTIAPPNTWIHSILPRLESNSSAAVVVAEGVQEIEQFARARISAAEPSSSSSSSSSSPSSSFSDTSLKHLEAHISTHLEPLIYSVFFPVPTISDDTLDNAVAGSSSSTLFGRSGVKAPLSSRIFDQITFKAYSTGLPFPTNRVIPHRLRDGVNAKLSQTASSLYQALSSVDYRRPMSEEERIKEEELAAIKEQMVSLNSNNAAKLIQFGREKTGFKEQFVRYRTESAAKEVLSPIVPLVRAYNSDSQPGSTIPFTLLHLFSLLAPLHLYTSGSILEEHPIAKLLFTPDFSPLAQFVSNTSQRLWSRHIAGLASSSDPQRWRRIVLGPQSHDAITPQVDIGATQQPSTSRRETRRRARTNATTAQEIASRSWTSYFTSFFSSNANARAEREKKAKAEREEEDQMTVSQRQARRKLNIMRAVWTASALMGTVGWLAFLILSGKVSIELRDTDEDDEDEEDEDEEDENGEGPWVFTRDDLEDEEDDIIVDEDDFDDDE